MFIRDLFSQLTRLEEGQTKHPPLVMIPQEILVQVLRSAYEDIILRVNRRKEILLLQTSMPTMDLLWDEFLPSQYWLSEVGLVCKLWNTASNSVLYENPILSSGQGICRLKHTLILRRPLAEVVQGLTLLDHPRGSAWQQYQMLDSTCKDRSSAKLAFQSLLPLCPNLTRFHSSYVYSDRPIMFSTMRPRVFSAAPAISLTNLRSISLDGFDRYLGIVSRDQGPCILPMVQTLALNAMMLGGLQPFQFPSLRILAISNCKYMESDLSHLLSTSAHLEIVSLVHNDVHERRTSDNIYQMLLLGQKSIRQLTLKGPAEWNAFRRSDWSTFTRLAVIEAGYTSEYPADCSKAILPPSLQNLTLMVMNRFGSEESPLWTSVYIGETRPDTMENLVNSYPRWRGFMSAHAYSNDADSLKGLKSMLRDQMIWVETHKIGTFFLNGSH